MCDFFLRLEEDAVFPAVSFALRLVLVVGLRPAPCLLPEALHYIRNLFVRDDVRLSVPGSVTERSRNLLVLDHDPKLLFADVHHSGRFLRCDAFHDRHPISMLLTMSLIIAQPESHATLICRASYAFKKSA